eukprot:CAMPEP_0204497920 /NCGR_PEP_ID=MMETSP0471-20130131/91854_1 /ASSEMBLY_ACC=CAM_ASM_000602 /TAXON_ID=2969 /ORGANISM="Oxyrrhis marina" /LENGTH=131 /DNA_ID=CAMNT_0051502351 /DNA_START=20 /DNA_END=412 /DNA_ORIENTATION=+
MWHLPPARRSAGNADWDTTTVFKKDSGSTDSARRRRIKKHTSPTTVASNGPFAAERRAARARSTRGGTISMASCLPSTASSTAVSRSAGTVSVLKELAIGVTSGDLTPAEPTSSKCANAFCGTLLLPAAPP